MAETLSYALHILRYPADDVNATIIVALLVVVAGLLLAVVLMAVGAPGSKSAGRGPHTDLGEHRTERAANGEPNAD